MSNMDVFEVFLLMARITESEGMRNMALVNLAVEEVEARLRPGQDTQEFGELLTYVCAAHAFYRYALIQCAAAPEGSFSANGVTVSRGDNSAQMDRARQLRDEFWRAASFLLQDSEEFYFCGMGGAGCTEN